MIIILIYARLSAFISEARIPSIVVDGDTIIVNLDGEDTRVRFIGIDTPESVHVDASLITAEGDVASDYTKALLTDTQVMLEFEVGCMTYTIVFSHMYILRTFLSMLISSKQDMPYQKHMNQIQNTRIILNLLSLKSQNILSPYFRYGDFFCADKKFLQKTPNHSAWCFVYVCQMHTFLKNSQKSSPQMEVSKSSLQRTRLSFSCFSLAESLFICCSNKRISLSLSSKLLHAIEISNLSSFFNK